MTNIKPIEKNNSGMITKIIFLGCLVITGLLLNQILSNQLKTKADILGEARKIKDNTEKEIINEFKNDDLIQSVLKQGEEVGNNILGEATQVVSNTATAASEMVRDIIFDSTVGNILKQVDNLPAWEQDKVREAVCKP